MATIPRSITDGLKLGFRLRVTAILANSEVFGSRDYVTALIIPYEQQWQYHPTQTCIPQTVLHPSPSVSNGRLGLTKPECIYTKRSKRRLSHLFVCNHASSTPHSEGKSGQSRVMGLTCCLRPYSQANNIMKHPTSNQLWCGRHRTIVSVALLSTSRSVHTAASVTSSSSQPLLSSRRGEMSSLEDAKHYVSSLTAYQQRTLKRALDEMDTNKESEGAYQYVAREKLEDTLVLI